MRNHDVDCWVISRAEDLVLAEERTTEADKELIMEGENIPIARLSWSAAVLVP